LEAHGAKSIGHSGERELNRGGKDRRWEDEKIGKWEKKKRGE